MKNFYLKVNPVARILVQDYHAVLNYLFKQHQVAGLVEYDKVNIIALQSTTAIAMERKFSGERKCSRVLHINGKINIARCVIAALCLGTE